MNEHPLISVLKTAGSQSERIARSLTSPYYKEYSISEAVLLADALVEDQTGHSALSDRWVAETRDADLVHARRESRRRTELRTTIAHTINDFPREYRDRLCEQLAAGNGPQEAEALQEATNAVAAVMLRNFERFARLTA